MLSEQTEFNSLGLFVVNRVEAMLAYWDKDQVCRFANNAYMDWFGKSREDIVGKLTLKELLGPLYEKNLPFIDGVLKGIPQVFERGIKVPSGEIRHSIANYYPHIINDEVIGFCVHVADVSGLKKLQKELASSELKFKDLLESAPDAIVIVNNEGIIDIVNAQTENLFGYTRSELQGKTIEILIPERFRKSHANKRLGFFSRPFAREMGAGFDLFSLHKNGSEFPVEISISPIQLKDGMYVSAAIRDVTERKKLQEHLEKSNERFLKFFNLNPIPTYITKVTDGQFKYVNDAFLNLISLKQEDVIGKTSTKLKLISFADRNKIISDIKQNGLQIRGLEFQIKNSNGKVINVLGSTEVIELENELYFLSTVIDITDRKETEEKLRNYAILESKSREMEQFAYAASHDLREPLLTIKNYMELLVANCNDKLDTTSQKYAQSILKAASRMDKLIKGLLDYSRLSQVKQLQKVDCNKIIENVIADLNMLITSNNTIINVEKLPQLKAYPLELELLFQNLIENAIKFRRLDVAPRINVSALKIKKGWQFAIKDNGIGVEAKDKEKIFNMFTRLHSRKTYEGTGIGLAQCKKITELHHGNIWVESIAGKSSTFYFTILILSDFEKET